jgi:hypothetical protein
MDIVQRYTVRKPGEQDARHMTNAQISAEVDAQSERLEAIRRQLFVLKCEQVSTQLKCLEVECKQVSAAETHRR